MLEPILVTGSSGNVGREVVRSLLERGWPVRATSLNEAPASHGDVETVRFDFGDRSTYAAAFDGVKKLFLMRPPQISDIETYIKPVIVHAASHGVEQIVFLSLLGAERNKFVPHAKVESLLRQSGVAYTLLRCGFFMQNLDTTHRADLVEYDDIFIPAGQGATAFIDTRDIGEVAAITLTEPGHDNQAYALTGEEALTYGTVAQMMTEELGRPITYSSPSMLAFARRMRERGLSWGHIGVMEAIYLTTRLGMAASVTPDAAELLGKPPIGMRQYIRDYRQAWDRAIEQRVRSM